jgi:hypothetical protein
MGPNGLADQSLGSHGTPVFVASNSSENLDRLIENLNWDSEALINQFINHPLAAVINRPENGHR